MLDRDFLLGVQRWPEVTAALLRRQERRAEWLSSVLAISHLPRVELRVLVLSWQFGDRWGKVRGGEVSVPIPLTHRNVARLIGARRPTVTTALGRLAEAGQVVGALSPSATSGPRLRCSPEGQRHRTTHDRRSV